MELKDVLIILGAVIAGGVVAAGIHIFIESRTGVTSTVAASAARLEVDTIMSSAYAKMNTQGGVRDEAGVKLRPIPPDDGYSYSM